MTNLREILSKYWSGNWRDEVKIIQAMKEACNSTVDLCMNNAETKLEPYYRGEGTVPVVINTQSIEKVKELLK